MESRENEVVRPRKIEQETLRRTVVNLRDSGMTYEAIAQKIEQTYGIKRTKQAIKGIYDRAVTSKDSDKTKITEMDMGLVSQVINIYARGYSALKTFEILQVTGVDIPYYRVNNIIKERDNYISNIESALIASIIDLISAGANREVILAATKYGGIGITDSKFNELMGKAYKIRVNNLVDAEAERYIAAGMEKKYYKNLSKAIKETP